MRSFLVGLFVLLATTSAANAARKSGDDIFEPGKVVAAVSLSTQTMKVIVGGYERYVWPVSTGAGSYATPPGVYGAEWLSKNHRSRKYNNAPMPYSMFLTKDGVALHGSPVRNGYASHGCIGLPNEFAAKVFAVASKGDKVIITRGETLKLGAPIL